MSEKSFSGSIYIDDTSPVRESGNITIQGTLLTFSNENRTVSFPIHSMKMRFGGTAKRIAYLSDPAQNNITLHTTDFSLLKHQAFQAHLAAGNVLGERKKHHSFLVSTFIILALAVLVPSYFVFIERTIVAGMIAERVPIEVEESLGDHVFNLQFGNSDALIKDQEVIEDLDTLIAPLLLTARNTGYTFKVHLIRDKSANAFALPGGHIVILTGLIEQSERPEELLGVLAHEMAHVTERHSLKQIISELSGYILFNIITSGSGDLVFSIGDNARSLLSKNYSRRQEQEADEIGFDYLIQTEISPTGLIEFFEKLQAEKSFMDSELLALASTHPTSDKRIKNFYYMLSEYEDAFDSIEFSYADFKRKISASSDFKNTETTDEANN